MTPQPKGLIELIEYSYQQVATFFPEAGLQGTPRLSVLLCEDSLCPRKQPDVSGPGLGEAGRYRMASEPTLAVSRARTGVSAEAGARTRGGADATGMCTGAWRVSARASGMRHWHCSHGRRTWIVGTGRTDVAHGPLALDVRDVARRGRSWLEIDRRGCRSLKGVRM